MVTLAPEDKPRGVDDIDRLVCAELPDANGTAAERSLRAIVEQCMMHGPCGDTNPACKCMQDGRCSKHYPRQFHDSTTLTDALYHVYRRRDNGRTVTKSFTLK
jgi:hypothetical protein